MNPICPYCNKTTELQVGSQVFPNRPDLTLKCFYVCLDCDARVGCHPGTTDPLGIPANAELRVLRGQLHEIFDPFWKRGTATRSAEYLWLRNKLGITKRQSHIAKFDLEMCAKALEFCKQRSEEEQKCQIK